MARIVLIAYTFMMYGLVCAFSLLFTDRAEKARNRVFFILYSIIAIMIPTIFAGLRGLNVGTDIMVYAYPIYEMAGRYADLGLFLRASSIENGYALVAYLCNQLGGDIHFFLGVTALLQILPIYISAVRLKNRCAMIWPMMTYLMIFYTVGFNVMRQSIAACWIVLAYVYLEDKKYVRAIVTSIIAVLFHSTGIIGIMLLVLALVLDNVKSKKKLVIICSIFFILFVYLMQYWATLLVFLGRYGFLGQDKIVGYTNIFGGGNPSSYIYSLGTAQYIETFFKVIFLIPVMIYRRKCKNQCFNTAFGVYFIGILIYLYFVIVHHTSYGYRVSIYAEYFLVVVLPFLFARKDEHSLENATKGRLSVRSLLTFALVFLNWFILFVVLQTHGTYPFKMFFE